MINQPTDPPPAAVTDPSTLVITSAPEAIKSARDFARGWFDAKGVEHHAAEIAILVIHELVTNAYRHGSAPGEVICVRLYRSVDGPVAEVRDGSEREPKVRPLTLDSFSGRGLAIVSELVQTWGYRPLASGGKAVYAVMKESVA